MSVYWASCTSCTPGCADPDPNPKGSVLASTLHPLGLLPSSSCPKPPLCHQMKNAVIPEVSQALGAHLGSVEAGQGQAQKLQPAESCFLSQWAVYR